MPTLPRRISLADAIDTVFVIAYKESTDRLEAALRQAGLPCEIVRQELQPTSEGMSPSYRCLLNHSRAWQRASRATKPTLIVEADFVPVLHLGQLPLPYNAQHSNMGIAWLYLCAPQLYSLSSDGYAEGFSTSMVAYIVTPQSAACLLELVEDIERQFGQSYSTWDSTVDRFLRDRGFKNYIPFRNYGEHGGRPNPEHRQHGLSTVHRADVLYGKLAFMPLYAIKGDKISHATYFISRCQARLRGLGRLLSGKFLRLKLLRHSKAPIRLLSFTIRRQLSAQP
jgi:hypothetical protein